MADATEFVTLGERVEHAIAALPTLNGEQIPLDDACPICLQSFEAICEGRVQEDAAPVNGLLIASDPEELRGVTKLSGCGHVFCRKDLIEWIRGWHGTCPTCRAQFANVRPPSDSEDGSSDGDYVPNEDDEDEDLDEEDGFVESDGWDTEVGDYDLDFDVEGDEADGFPPQLHWYPDVDMAADIDAFIEAHRDGRDALHHEQGPGVDLGADVNAFIDAHGYARGGILHPEDGPVEATGYRGARSGPRGLRGPGLGADAIEYNGSEAEVSQGLNVDGDEDMDEDREMWGAAEDEAMMENWGLSHSDGDASESLSEGELFGSMEDDSHVEDDAAVIAEPDSPSVEVPGAETK